MTALDKLIEAVEAGNATEFQFHTWRPGLTGTIKESKTMWRAYNGSLDAAKALHGALLHERAFVEIHWSTRYDAESRVTISHGDEWWAGAFTTPARAWLLAILRAYRSTQP